VSQATKEYFAFVRSLGLWGEQWLIREWEAKLDLLLEHYCIEESDRLRWKKLSFCLALDHVPGMQVVESRARKGAPLKYRAQKFVELIDSIRDERGKGLEDAIRIARRRGKLFGDTRALSNRYRLSKRQIEEHARWRDKLKHAPTLAQGVRRMLDVELNKSSPKIK
jgi:hypothetical protein